MLAIAAVAWSDAKLTVPDLFGKTQDEANAIVKNAGFAYEPGRGGIGCKGPTPTGKPNEWRVYCQDPAPGTLVDKHAMIQIELWMIADRSAWIEKEFLRSLIGLPIDQAKQKLHDVGHLGFIEVNDYTGKRTCKRGTVCGVEPFEAILKHGDLILYVAPVDIP